MCYKDTPTGRHLHRAGESITGWANILRRGELLFLRSEDLYRVKVLRGGGFIILKVSGRRHYHGKISPWGDFSGGRFYRRTQAVPYVVWFSVWLQPSRTALDTRHIANISALRLSAFANWRQYSFSRRCKPMCACFVIFPFSSSLFNFNILFLMVTMKSIVE